MPEAPPAQERAPARAARTTRIEIASTIKKPRTAPGRPWLCIVRRESGLLREIGDDRPLDHEQRLLQGSLIEVEEVGLFLRVCDDLVDDVRDRVVRVLDDRA